MRYLDTKNQKIYYMYDQIMFHKEKKNSNSVFRTDTFRSSDYNGLNEKSAVVMIKYAFENYMFWSPIQIKKNISDEIIQHLNLDYIVNKRINYPPELDPANKYDYILHLMYPDIFNYDSKEAVIEYYDKVLAGDIDKFPKQFFITNDNSGKKRACICFLHMLNLARPFTSIREMYDYFGKGACRELLNEYNLLAACHYNFQFPLDFLHYSLPVAARENLYYSILRLSLVQADYERRKKKALKREISSHHKENMS